MRVLFFAVLLAVSSVSCASPPKAHEFQSEWTFSRGYDQVWSAAVEMFSDNNWSIDAIEKDSGIISSEWHTIPTEREAVDPGGRGLAINHQQEIRLSLRVKPAGEDTKLKVNAKFREKRSLDSSVFYAECTSKGLWEKRVYEGIRRRLDEDGGKPEEAEEAAEVEE